MGMENLYGVPIYVYREGFRGQYIRHDYFYREGERYWGIEVGIVEMYGRLKKPMWVRDLPLVIMGAPTRFARELRPEQFEDFILEVVPTGYLEVRETQMINLESCMQARDPILIVDKYNLLGEKAVQPSELVERLIEYQRIIEQQQRAIWEYEKAVREAEATRSIWQAEVAKARELSRALESRLARLTAEVTGIQGELTRLRAELGARAAEIEAAEKIESYLKSVQDALQEVIEEAKEVIGAIREATKAIRAEGGGRE